MKFSKFIRYNTDRICNGLHATEPFSDFRKPIKHGYYPKMVTNNSGRNITPRQDNASMQDLRRDFEFVEMKVTDLERMRDRVIQCIDQGFLLDVSVCIHGLN